MKVLLISESINDYYLESSYLRSCKELGFMVETFSFNNAFSKYNKLGKIGRTISNHVYFESWIQNANRDLVLKAKEYNPDLILVFCNVRITAGSLMYLRSILNAKIVLVWPDALSNLKSNTLNTFNHYDLCACYSKSGITPFLDGGFKRVAYIPLAGDLNQHFREVRNNPEYIHDISFVGNWRPEREAFMEYIIDQFPNLRIALYGISWKPNLKNKFIKKFVIDREIIKEEMTYLFEHTKININIIDPLNYPTANMRFFEISTAGGLQLVSRCPELENDFVDKQDLFYFNDKQDLKQKIEDILSLSSTYDIRKSAQNKIISGHSYTHRLTKIIENLN